MTLLSKHSSVTHASYCSYLDLLASFLSMEVVSRYDVTTNALHKMAFQYYADTRSKCYSRECTSIG